MIRVAIVLMIGASKAIAAARAKTGSSAATLTRTVARKHARTIDIANRDKSAATAFATRVAEQPLIAWDRIKALPRWGARSAKMVCVFRIAAKRT